MYDTAAIVVTYNRCDMLKECISCLLESDEKADILVIDNASTDQTQSVVEDFGNNESIKYYNTGKNLGGAGGFNFGIKKAYELGYKYFWLMDDDTMVQESTLKELYVAKELVGESFGFLSSMAVWIDDSPCEMNKHEVLPNVKVWNQDKKLCQYGLVRIIRATFVSFFVSRETVKKVGLPIKEYFIWGDDTEYSLRISNELPCYFVSKSVVVHKMKTNQTSASIAEISDPERIKRMSLSIRNDFCTYRRLGFKKSIKNQISVAKLLHKVLKSNNPYKALKIKMIINGWVKGLFFRPPIEQI